MSNSLRGRYPRRFEVPLLILLSFGLLLMGLSRPLMKVEKMVFWKNEYSVLQGVRSLWEQSQYALATILFFFSIVFPVVKLTALALIWYMPLPEQKRQTGLHWLGLLGKWSMLDVFVVAILIVLVKLGPLAKIEPQRGLYWFAAAILTSMITSMYVERLARKMGN
ncbi:MAG TPA: paraquat-inducible protein A [Verrucomicrobiae bacterium]|nr:paraquat-inducible protein A [Verrucomicrobiae bacterium]